MITAKQFIKDIDEEGQEWSDDTEVMASYFEDYAKLYHESEVLKLNKAFVSGRSELLFAFIEEVKNEFADQKCDYLYLIAERVLKANNSH